MGIEVMRSSDTLESRRIQLLRRMSVSVVLDVGANIGQYALQLRSSGYSGRILSYEPLDDAYAVLRQRCASDPLWECVSVALGSRSGEADIHISANSVSSSLRPMVDRLGKAAPGARYVGRQRVHMATLDGASEEHILRHDRLALKMDVQGYEDEVLLGSKKTLGQVVVLESELSLVPLYAGQRTMHEMIEMIEQLGFKLFWLEKEFWDPTDGQLLQVNGLFTRV